MEDLSGIHKYRTTASSPKSNPLCVPRTFPTIVFVPTALRRHNSPTNDVRYQTQRGRAPLVNRSYSEGRYRRQYRFLSQPDWWTTDLRHPLTSSTMYSSAVRSNPERISSPNWLATSCSWKMHDSPPIECRQSLDTALRPR